MNITFFKKKKFNQEELSWAISLIEKEFVKEERDTPLKMSLLISSNFDTKCDPGDIERFFNLKENYELESKKIEYYG